MNRRYYWTGGIHGDVERVPDGVAEQRRIPWVKGPSLKEIAERKPTKGKHGLTH